MPPSLPIRLRILQDPLLFLLCASVRAEVPTPSSDWEPFLGLSVAWVDQRPDAPTPGQPASRSTAALALYGGARWRRAWGFELEQAFYCDFAADTPGGSQDRDVCSTSATGLAWIPLGGSFSAYARAGVAFWTATQGEGYAFLTTRSETSTSGSTVHLGLGIEAALGRGWFVRLEGSLLPKVLDHRLTRLGAGVAFRF